MEEAATKIQVFYRKKKTGEKVKEDKYMGYKSLAEIKDGLEIIKRIAKKRLDKKLRTILKSLKR